MFGQKSHGILGVGLTALRENRPQEDGFFTIVENERSADEYFGDAGEFESFGRGMGLVEWFGSIRFFAASVVASFRSIGFGAAFSRFSLSVGGLFVDSLAASAQSPPGPFGCFGRGKRTKFSARIFLAALHFSSWV